jgi:hypothetical protein
MNARLFRTTAAALLLAASVNSSFSQSNKERSLQPIGNVVDNAGKTLGPIVGFLPNRGVVILLQVQGKLTSLQLQPLELDGGLRVDYNKLAPAFMEAGAVFFADFNCAGTAYFQPNNSVPGASPSLTIGNKFGLGVLYVGGESLQIGSAQFRSRFDPRLYQCVNGEGTVDFVIPVLHAVDLNSTFASPYSVK